ncbi:MAG: hypothetical protein IPH77_12585 [Ignavibacteria bacterium]|nr:hypothetical protein [Ignavibacteria bacterium]
MKKNYKWFYEGDKFAPENFTIPESILTRTKSILSKAQIGKNYKDEHTDQTES